MCVCSFCSTVRISTGYDLACNIAIENLRKIADKVAWSKENNQIEPLIETAMTSLGSKMYVIYYMYLHIRP